MKLIVGAGVSAIALALALSLAGCGRKDEAKATQVAAKVNGDEITVHQINFALSRLGNLDPAQAKQAAVQVLKGLVDKQLLVQQAVAAKLDRDPGIVQALDESRRQILATAYVERLAQKLPKSAEAEVKAFYAKNPAIFSERRIYKLQELLIQTTPQNAPTIKARLGETKNLAEFGEWLKAQNIPARGAQYVKPAEQLPMELLPRLHPMKDGQSLVLSGNNQITMLFLLGSQTQPLSEVQARPMIERYLGNIRKRELAEANLRKLREAAKIEYKGDYAGVAKAAEIPSPQGAAAAPPDQEGINKGLQGLK